MGDVEMKMNLKRMAKLRKQGVKAVSVITDAIEKIEVVNSKYRSEQEIIDGMIADYVMASKEIDTMVKENEVVLKNFKKLLK